MRQLLEAIPLLGIKSDGVVSMRWFSDVSPKESNLKFWQLTGVSSSKLSFLFSFIKYSVTALAWSRLTKLREVGLDRLEAKNSLVL